MPAAPLANPTLNSSVSPGRKNPTEQARLREDDGEQPGHAQRARQQHPHQRQKPLRVIKRLQEIDQFVHGGPD